MYIITYVHRKEGLNLIKLKKDTSKFGVSCVEKLYMDVCCRQVMNKEELEEMKEEEKKDSLFACVQRWLESLPDLAEFPGKFERAIKEMIEKKQNSIKKDGNQDYEKKIKQLEEVQLLFVCDYVSACTHRRNYGMIHLSRRTNMTKEVHI